MRWRKIDTNHRKEWVVVPLRDCHVSTWSVTCGTDPKNRSFFKPHWSLEGVLILPSECSLGRLSHRICPRKSLPLLGHALIFAALSQDKFCFRLKYQNFLHISTYYEQIMAWPGWSIQSWLTDQAEMLDLWRPFAIDQPLIVIRNNKS